MSSSTLSIIIPTSNRLHTLSRALNSILSQNVENIDVIIVDDSRESLVEQINSLVAPFLKKNLSINVFRNNGLHSAARARNLGVSKAAGKYITFLDDDDIYLPGRLSNMLQVAFTGDYSMVSSGRFYESGDLSVMYEHKKQKFGVITLNDVTYLNDIDIGFIIERNRFLELGGFNESMASLEDWDFIIRHLSNGSCYKIRRLDYAVNIEPNKVRVSNNDGLSYKVIAETYKSRFGRAWYACMNAHSLSLTGELSFYLLLKYSLLSFKFYPLFCYLRQLKNYVKGLIKK